MTDMTVDAISPRLVYDPAGQSLAAPSHAGPAGPLRTLVGYYRDPLSWLVLALTAVVLCYLGGLVLFWFHSVELGEGGPQISWYAHWLLDSTFAFLGLTPALAVILPAAAWAARSLAGSQRILPWLHAAIAGLLFAVVTTPGPLAHNLIVGRGTWIANHVTELVGDPSAPLRPATEYPPIVSMSQQLGAAVPLYIILTGLTVLVLRTAVARRRDIGRAAKAGGGVTVG
jgi:hypothetical protein